VPEIEKALAELKRLMEYRRSAGIETDDFLGLGLTSRKNLCVHPEVELGPLLSGRSRSMILISDTGLEREEGEGS
jgi:DEAD_2